jgi:hypothetical protein
MIRVIQSKERHHENFGWLDTYWHFSFDTYHDPENTHWGALRVFNDDVVEPGRGFGMHPHRDMEIITYVLSGQLEHKDSLGNRGVVHPGEVQVMSAGSGITHSEYNPSPAEPVHLMQIWIFPRTRGLTPRWAQRQFTPEERAGKLLRVVAGSDSDGTLTIDQDAEVFVSALKSGEEVTHTSRAGRKAYLFVIDGGAEVNGLELARGDQARIADETELNIKATDDAELILLDLPDAR